MANDLQSLAHTRWNCKYHIVFAPKYRRMVFYGEKKAEIGKIIRQLCEWKGVEIHEAEVCPDHIHMLVKHTTQGSSIELYGIPEREKQCARHFSVSTFILQVQLHRWMFTRFCIGCFCT